MVQPLIDLEKKNEITKSLIEAMRARELFMGDQRSVL